MVFNGVLKQSLRKSCECTFMCWLLATGPRELHEQDGKCLPVKQSQLRFRKSGQARYGMYSARLSCWKVHLVLGFRQCDGVIRAEYYVGSGCI